MFRRMLVSRGLPTSLRPRRPRVNIHRAWKPVGRRLSCRLPRAVRHNHEVAGSNPAPARAHLPDPRQPQGGEGFPRLVLGHRPVAALALVCLKQGIAKVSP